MTRFLSLLFTLCLTLTIQAQNETQGTVSTTQSADIDALVNQKPQKQEPQVSTSSESAEPASTSEGTSTSSERRTQTNTQRPRNTYRETTRTTQQQKPNDDEMEGTQSRGHDYTQEETVTGPKVMRSTHKMKGFRVQIYSGGNKGIDRKRAQEAGHKVKKKYPSIPVYVHFYSPRWMCRIGNFKTRKEAEVYQKKLKEMGFKNACIVHEQITVDYSK